MAKKSKTQRAKASAARQERKAARAAAEAKAAEEPANEHAKAAEGDEKGSKGGLFKKSEGKKDEALASAEKGDKAVKKDAKADKKDKKPGRVVTFFRGVRSEMKRVTWPTRQDVIRWSGVVVAALLFFGVYVAVLDNLVVTPLLVGISSLGEMLA